MEVRAITEHGTVAQWLEQASYKRQVGSSILPSPTKHNCKGEKMKWQLDKERYLSRQPMQTGSDEGGIHISICVLTFLWLGYAAVAIYDAMS